VITGMLGVTNTSQFSGMFPVAGPDLDVLMWDWSRAERASAVRIGADKAAATATPMALAKNSRLEAIMGSSDLMTFAPPRPYGLLIFSSSLRLTAYEINTYAASAVHRQHHLV